MVTTGCSSTYCVQGTNSVWDDVYSANTGSTVPSYNGELYWTGYTNGHYLYYKSATTQWCLSTYLGGPCLLSGPSPSPNSCPNLSPFLFSSGNCQSTTTTTTNPCNDFDFEAYFDCYVPPTTTTTSTSTTTTTTTLPPSICSGVGVNAIAQYVEPTSTTTTSTTTIAPIVRDCIFFGDVTFTTVSSIIECPGSDGEPLSEQFQDCYTGELLYAPIPILTPSGNTITKFMIFRATVDGVSRCISYLGQNTCNTGVNNIILNEGPIGYSNIGQCDLCVPPPTTTTTTTIAPPCTSCPEGYVLLPDGFTCEKILVELATPPLNPRIIGVNYENYPATNGGDSGLIVYEEITNKGWPIFGLPNRQGLLSSPPSYYEADPISLSIIPNSGYTNQGVFYNSLSPSSLPNTPHASLDYPSGYWPVSPWPPSNNPPNIPNLLPGASYTNLSYLSESVVISNVLNLGSGSSVNIEYNRNDNVNLLWGKYSVANSWPSTVGVWSDAPSPYNSGSQYVLENSWIGITQCVTIEEEKKYYLLINANNSFRLSINGLLAIEINNGDGARQPLSFINCFPITLPAGTSTISVEAGNYASGGNFAFELLDIPLDILLSASTYSSIEPYVLFSTKQKRPRAFDINFVSGSTTITSSGEFLPTDVGGFVQFPSFVYSGTYITEVIDSNTAIINSGATATGLGLSGDTNGPSTGRIYFIFDTGQLFASGLPQGFTCPAGYTYVNCGGPTCLSISRIFCPSIPSCVCPEGFDVLPNDEGCQKISAVTPTIISSSVPTQGIGNIVYGAAGILIYNVDDYNLSGTTISGTYAYINNTNSFWKGRMNDSLIWMMSSPNWPSPNYPGTLSMCDTIILEESKTYYIGAGGDNAITITINGVTIISQQQNPETSTNFIYWRVYPITLNAGTNIIELSNTNTSDVGGYAAEIYDNTLIELTGATNITMVNRVFSTKDYWPGQPKEGQGFCTNYECPEGFAYDVDSGLCLKIEYTDCT